MAAIRELLVRDDVALVTLTGPGGVGKTRLALEAANGLTDNFSDGVWFVELASITDLAHVIPTVAQTLGLRDIGNETIESRLTAFLANKRALLLLDNFEHVIDAAGNVALLVDSCPNLTILVTSRESLKISDEWEYPVSPLDLPDKVNQQPSDLLKTSGAVQLFISRAQAVVPAFNLTSDNALLVAEICRRVDGLPLAIELAAARTKALPPSELLARLDQPLTLLSGTRRDSPIRQQTMRNTIAWSYELLSPGDQHVFRRLGVFIGSFSLDAAVAVAGSKDGPQHDVFESVLSLVEKSLLRSMTGPGGSARYQMLETVRDYALECLKAAHEDNTTTALHAAYYTDLAERQSEWWLQAEQADALDRSNADRSNVLQALSWLEDAGDGDRFLRLSAALAPNSLEKSSYIVSQQWIERALDAYPNTSVFSRAIARYAAGFMAGFRGDYANAEIHLSTSIELWKQTSDRIREARTLEWYGFLAYRLGDYKTAQDRVVEAISMFEAAGIDVAHPQPHLADAMNSLADSYLAGGESDAAYARYVEIVDIARRFNMGFTLCDTLSGLANIVLERGEIDRAEAIYREALSLSLQFRQEPRIASALVGLAAVAEKRGHADLTAMFFGAADLQREAVEADIYPRDFSTYHRALAGARKELGHEAFEAKRLRGRDIPIEELTSDARFAPSTGTQFHEADGDRIGPTSLTPRELDVLRLIADGKSDRDIADALFIGTRTVQTHVANVLSKLEVANRAEAAAKAVKLQIV